MKARLSFQRRFGRPSQCDLPIDPAYKLSWTEFSQLHPEHEVLFSFGDGEVERCPDVVAVLREIPARLEPDPVGWYSKLIGFVDGLDFRVARKPDGSLWKILVVEGNGDINALIFNADNDFLLQDLSDDSALPVHYIRHANAANNPLDWSGVHAKYEAKISAWLLAH